MLLECGYIVPYVSFWVIALAYLVHTATDHVSVPLAGDEARGDEFRARHVPHLYPSSLLKIELIALASRFEVGRHASANQNAVSVHYTGT